MKNLLSIGDIVSIKDSLQFPNQCGRITEIAKSGMVKVRFDDGIGLYTLSNGNIIKTALAR